MPDPPINARIVRADGTELPCELTHYCTNDDGTDIWQAAGAEFHPERGDTIKVDLIPPRTGIRFNTPALRRYADDD